MRSLFVKIFLSFASILVLSIATGAIFAYYNKPEGVPHSLKSFAGAAIHQYAEHGLKAFKTGGDEALRHYIDDLHKKSGIRLFFLFEKQQQVNLPRDVRKTIRRAINRGELVRAKKMDRPHIAIPLDSSFKPLIAAAVQLAPVAPSPHSRQPPFLTAHFILPRLLSFLIIASLICYFLARSLTAPIRQLRAATLSFAAGNLSTRVNTTNGGSSEINQLGDEFNAMAEQIEDLVVSQQRLQRDISHELRSPLARLNIALELCRQRCGDRANTELDRIDLESQRLNEMIGQLLSLNQIDSQPIDLFAELDLSILLNKLIIDANFEAQERQVTVVVKQPSSLIIQGSQELLKRAIENIIRNAIHYSPIAGEVVITVTTKEKAITVIEVSDNGEGVPEEQLEKIFDPFYRVAASRDRRSGGTGIGLAISQRSIKRHNGTISATNRTTGGLTITMTLPNTKIEGSALNGTS